MSKARQEFWWQQRTGNQGTFAFSSLSAAGADVNNKDEDGTTPTMNAAMCGHMVTVKELHSLGADVSAADKNGLRAAMAAAEVGHTATVKKLHSLGADVNTADNYGCTAVKLQLREGARQR